jgi:hypothetical protein
MIFLSKLYLSSLINLSSFDIIDLLVDIIIVNF